MKVILPIFVNSKTLTSWAPSFIFPFVVPKGRSIPFWNLTRHLSNLSLLGHGSVAPQNQLCWRINKISQWCRHSNQLHFSLPKKRKRVWQNARQRCPDPPRVDLRCIKPRESSLWEPYLGFSTGCGPIVLRWKFDYQYQKLSGPWVTQDICGMPWKMQPELLCSASLLSFQKTRLVCCIPEFFILLLIVAYAGMKNFANIRGQWMVITYVWVLEVNTGATFRTAYLRLVGLILRRLDALTVKNFSPVPLSVPFTRILWVPCCFFPNIIWCFNKTWSICGTNPYGLVIMVTLVDFPVTWLIINSSVPSMGTVINVTVAPIAFTHYIVMDMTTKIGCIKFLLFSSFLGSHSEP